MQIRMRAAVLTALCVGAPLWPAVGAQGDVVPFDEEHWIFKDAQITDHLGRKALAGLAWLKDVDLQDGVIEVDVAAGHVPSYPGILFRMRSESDCERVYLRPHRAGHYPDAVQYTPVFNGIAGWQIYNGEGYTAPAALPADEWVHLRLEVRAAQARLFIGDDPRPTLSIVRLEHGLSRGAIGLMGPKDGSAYFSNFSYRPDDDLCFAPPPPIDPAPGLITRWQLSQPLKLGRLDPSRPMREQDLPELRWASAPADSNGMLDVARFVARPQGEQGEPDCVFARATVHADRDRVRPFAFGYSDAATVYLNDAVLFTGESAYRQRDPSFLGIVGLFDTVNLPLKKGENTLVVLVAESFGGWGLIGRFSDEIYEHPGLARGPESERIFLSPESVAYDPEEDVVYVSNFDGYNSAPPAEGQFISRMGADGRVLTLKWVGGLRKPTGLTVSGKRLYAAERTDLAEIDTGTGTLVQRYPAPRGIFLNDVAVDQSGVVYVSDGPRATIFRLRDGRLQEWVAGPEIGRPNGIVVDGARLLVVCNDDRRVKAIDLETKAITVVADMPYGTLDGIEVGPHGSLLVSETEGRLYRIDATGRLEKLLDLSGPGTYCADFEYVPASGLLLIPTFADNRVLRYRLAD
jgi:sugar lactone lactonase YvrE